MLQFGKQHKIIANTWAFTALTFADFTLTLVGTNTEKDDRQLVTPKFSPPYLWNNTVEKVYSF